MYPLSVINMDMFGLIYPEKSIGVFHYPFLILFMLILHPYSQFSSNDSFKMGDISYLLAVTWFVAPERKLTMCNPT
jgi:hypothetical protein